MAGIGDIFRSFIHFLKPLVKDAGHAINKKDTGARILRDIVQGRDIKNAVITEAGKHFKDSEKYHQFLLRMREINSPHKIIPEGSFLEQYIFGSQTITKFTFWYTL
jgi:hypothetical protein